MKKFLVGAVATAALLVPAVASADTNAVVGLQYGSTDYGIGDIDEYDINAAFSHDMSNGWLFQFDGERGRLSDDGGGPDLDTGYAAGHLGVRNENHALAGFVGFQDFFGISGTSFGVEGQMYLNNIVLGGSLGHVDFGDADFGATSLQLDGAYFFSPNLSVNALVAQSEGTDDFDTDWTSYGVGGEYRFNNPLSINAGWRTDDFEGGEADTWTIGLSYDFGTGSLHERATTGPSLQGARNLSNTAGAILP
jgi:opacity protein-like surface antigen